MSAKTIKTIYFIATGLFTASILMSASMYFIEHEMVSETFARLGYPVYLVYPLAIAKFLGLIAIWTKKSNTLKEWAYAGFFFDFVLTICAHTAAKDGGFVAPLVMIVILLVSYIFEKKAYKNNDNN